MSRIASFDWPDAWPELFDLLIQALHSMNANVIHGAMRVFTGLKNVDFLHLKFFFVMFNQQVYNIDVAQELRILQSPLVRILLSPLGHANTQHLES